MKRLVSSLVLFVVLTLVPVSTAHAATKPSSKMPFEPTVGYDVSSPQCSEKLPTTAAFVVVGVNGGNAANTNPCLVAELSWAKKATISTSTKQPTIQLYVNTANPGDYISDIMTWPTNGYSKSGTLSPNPYGVCSGVNDLACSWQYGWNRAEENVLDRFTPAAQKAGVSTVVADYTWWLDVETMNTWQSGSSAALDRNTAALEGMASYYTSPSRGGKIGIYSTAVQWNEITGTTTSTVLAGLPNWRPSGSQLNNAVANCKVPPLTNGGYIALTQYVQGGIDKNHSCI